MNTAIQKKIQLVLGLEDMFADGAHGAVATAFGGHKMGVFANDRYRVSGRGRKTTGFHHSEINQVITHEAGL